MISRRLAVAAWLACACAAFTVGAQQVNPYEGDAAAVRAGSVLYAGRCADCHGADAKGTRGPDLTQRWAAGASDESVFATIRRGVAGSIMPPSASPDHELWAIVAYLRSISTVPALASTGDANRGRTLFVTACEDCHRVGGRGGALGPELTRIGRTRSREALVGALREPGGSVALGYRAVRVVTRRGARHEGTVKAEDAFSIQLMSAAGRLQGFRKAELTLIEPIGDSLMPRFAPEKLGDAALEDLLAYLGTLR